MERIRTIAPPDAAAAKAAKAHWDSVAKPLGSLGLLESAIERIAAIQGSEAVRLSDRRVIVFCADNGVVCEGVTQSDQSVTALCTEAIAGGTSNVNRMAAAFDATVTAVDMGVAQEVRHPGVVQKRLANGTQNLAVGPAMTREQAERAVCIGMDLAKEHKAAGADILLTGEMGIGNTTTAAALSAVLLGLPVDVVTGRGAGLDSAGLSRKVAVIERAIAVNQPDPADPMDLLAKLGGFDIAGMVGLFLGGAVYRIPVVIDGVISAVAALLACKIAPDTRHYLLASHVSDEPAGKLLLEQIGLPALIHAQMRLGEGTGGVLLLPLLDGALAVYHHAHRFDEIALERYVELQ